jgi:hypothetical protein
VKVAKCPSFQGLDVYLPFHILLFVRSVISYSVSKDYSVVEGGWVGWLDRLLALSSRGASRP